METLLRDDSWNPWSGRASALSNLRFCLLLALSSRIGWIVSIYNRGAKLAIFYGIFVFFRSEMRGDVSLVLWFSMVKIKKERSAILRR